MTDELKQLLAEQGKAFTEFKSSLEAKLAEERKEREELEMKLNRQGLPGSQGVSAKELKAESDALRNLLRTGDDRELKTMSVGSDPDGGYWVLPHFSQTMTQKIFEVSPLRRYARTVTIATDSFEEVEDLNEAEAAWVGETAARADTTTPQIGKYKIEAHELYCMPKATQKIIDDANIDLGAWLSDKIAKRFARMEGAAFISGDGIAKPKGILSYATASTGDSTRPWGTIQYIPTGHASSFTTSNPADVLIDLQMSLKSDYRPGAIWLMNRATAAVVRKLKDGNGDYLWARGLAAGQPDTLLGHPVVLDEEMPNIGANEFPIAFGDFGSGYTIVDRHGSRIMPDPYTSKPYVKFYAYRRVGGGVNNTEAFKLLKCATS